jgi:polyferredoxin
MKIVKNLEKPIQKYRFYVQTAFAALCVWIGIEFYFFIKYLESGGAIEYSSRPPGVDGFLPISSLMNGYYFLLTGEVHDAHPAGLFILMGIVAISFVFGKSFCSWFCPVGFLSELVGDFGERLEKKLFKKKLKMPRWLDYPLRSLKYLMLGFFVYSIFFSMSALALKYFLSGPYNVMSDVKMYYFFADISKFALIVLAVLFVLSIVIRNFWCRYLCPYGALLGFISFFSPSKIKRNPISCIDCGLCAKACPSNIKVDKVITVISDECTSCMSCVDACPVADTLELKNRFTKKKIPKIAVAIGVVVLYLAVAAIGVISGNWQNKVSKEEYLYYFQHIDMLGHPTTTSEIESLNKESARRENGD